MIMDISVIVPLYKGEKYIPHILGMLNENIYTLEKHMMKKELEVIFYNDYPEEKIDRREYSELSDIEIRFCENSENLGIHETRKRGVLEAKGDYITFLDQDDELSKLYFLRQLECIGDADAVMCNGIYRGNRVIYRDINQQRQAVFKDNYIRKGNIIVSPGQMLIKKTAIPDEWMEHILKENGSDDVLLWTLMLCQGKRFALNPHIDYVHKEDGKNTSLDFENMKRSAEELVETVNEARLLDDKELRVFEKGVRVRIDKYNGYLDVLYNWEIILKNIVRLIKTKDYEKVAIYGYGVLGKKLLSALERLDVPPLFIIDKGAKNFKNVPYQIYEPEYVPRETELILLTPLFAEEEIRNLLKETVPASKVVSLKEMSISAK